ncbi:unnamed protein product, partial [Cylicocyclus nassatus]
MSTDGSAMFYQTAKALWTLRFSWFSSHKPIFLVLGRKYRSDPGQLAHCTKYSVC